jgi:papain like cysteine protease AvrRpt2
LIELNVPCQKYRFWCWAAVAAAIFQLHNPDSIALTQCQVASRQQGAGDCCNNPCGKDCNRRLPLQKALCSVHCLDQGPVLVPATFSFSDLKALLQPAAPAKPRPVCARIQWDDGGGHFVVIKGLQETSQSVLYADPFDGEHLMTFNDFKGGGLFSLRTWTHYYLTDKVNHGNCN